MKLFYLGFILLNYSTLGVPMQNQECLPGPLLLSRLWIPSFPQALWDCSKLCSALQPFRHYFSVYFLSVSCSLCICKYLKGKSGAKCQFTFLGIFSLWSWPFKILSLGSCPVPSSWCLYVWFYFLHLLQWFMAVRVILDKQVYHFW